MANDMIVKVDSVTHRRYKELAKKRKTTIGEVAKDALKVAQMHNFSEDIDEKKFITKEVNRMIGFFKTNEKKMEQMEKNILYSFDEKVAVETLTILTLYIQNTIDVFAKKYDDETVGKIEQIMMDNYFDIVYEELGDWRNKIKEQISFAKENNINEHWEDVL